MLLSITDTKTQNKIYTFKFNEPGDNKKEWIQRIDHPSNKYSHIKTIQKLAQNIINSSM